MNEQEIKQAIISDPHLKLFRQNIEAQIEAAAQKGVEIGLAYADQATHLGWHNRDEAPEPYESVLVVPYFTGSLFQAMYEDGYFLINGMKVEKSGIMCWIDFDEFYRESGLMKFC